MSALARIVCYLPGYWISDKSETKLRRLVGVGSQAGPRLCSEHSQLLYTVIAKNFRRLF